MSRWKTMKAVWLVCVALGWWGFWFPELAVWTETICVAEEESDSRMESAREVWKGLMHAQRDQIKMKSRLLEIVERYLQKP